jgi:hypothetical protein
MTLSNFDWTDKDSVRWFILLPTGHEGPYSLTVLIKLQRDGKIASDIKIWAEGLTDSVTLSDVLKEEDSSEDGPPPLPPEALPPLPEFEEEVRQGKSKRRTYLFISLTVTIMLLLAFGGALQNQKKISIHRLPKMDPKLHERIQDETQFKSWGEKIFFREYVPQDQSRIWLVTSSFQSCDVEASFQSMKDKLLTTKEDEVAFKTQGKLAQHVVEFTEFTFLKGNKMIPGLYEMDVRATNCKWEGIVPRLMNGFSGPEEDYVARTKVVLFSKGPVKFNKILANLIKKKMEKELLEQNREEFFWQDLQQKLETLQAVSLQIEQLLMDFFQKGPKNYRTNLRKTVEVYTRKYGSFLSKFVTDNEKYFRELDPGLKNPSVKKSYEETIRLSSKRIGLETMKFIEELQGRKKDPGPQELAQFRARVQKAFSAIKNDLGQKIIQVSEDRSK